LQKLSIHSYFKLSTNTAGQSSNPLRDLSPESDFFPKCNPGLGPRMAGKLLQDFGSSEAIFTASLTALEAKRLPAGVA
jgi:hypothetical protein